MKNQPLIQEVIAQISHRFTPKIPDIKKARSSMPVLSVILILESFHRQSIPFSRRSILSVLKEQGILSRMLLKVSKCMP